MLGRIEFSVVEGLVSQQSHVILQVLARLWCRNLNKRQLERGGVDSFGAQLSGNISLHNTSTVPRPPIYVACRSEWR